MKKLFSLVLAFVAITTMAFAATEDHQLDCGKTVKITATPETGYEFVEWEEDGNKDNPRIVTVSANATFTAVFAKKKITIPAGDLPDPDDVDTDGTKPDGVYEYGDVLKFTPKDKECLEFSEWFDHNTDNPRTYTVGVDDPSILQQIVPQYADIYYTIRFFDEDKTNVLKTENVKCGTTPTAPADPTKQGDAEHTYVFKGWNVVAATKDSDYVAKFADTKTKYTFDDNSFNENVEVKDEDGNEPNREYEFGDTFTVTAKDIDCKTFIGWSDQTPAEQKTRTFIVGQNDEANFVPVYADIYYTIKFLNWDNSLIEEQNVKCGVMPTAPTNPTREHDAEHTYTFKGWNTEIVKASQDAQYVAQYDQDDRIYTIPGSDLPDENVDVDGDHENGEYNYGDEIKFTPKDIECEEFTGWADDTETDPHKENPRIFTVGVDNPSILQNFVPQYKAIKYTITTAVKPGDDSQTHGTVSAEVVE